MKKIVRQITIRFESEKDPKENFVIESNTALMKVPNVGEVLNISKMQYEVAKVVTNLNIPNPTTSRSPVTVNEFSGVSYYVKIIRRKKEPVANETKQDNSDIIKTLNNIMDYIRNNANTIDKPVYTDIKNIIDDITTITEHIKRLISVTATSEDLLNMNKSLDSRLNDLNNFLCLHQMTKEDLEDLKEYISNVEFRVTTEVEDDEYTFENIKEDLNKIHDILNKNKENPTKSAEPVSKTSTDKYKTLSISREYRLHKAVGKGYSNDYDVLGYVDGIKVKVKDPITEKAIYTSATQVNYLNYIIGDDGEVFKGIEINDVYIKLKQLESYLVRDSIIEKGTTLSIDYIIDNFKVSDIVVFSIKYPDAIYITNYLSTDDKYKDNCMILNYYVRNK